MHDVIPIAALFDHALGPNLADDPRGLLQSADVIVAVDVMSQAEALIYGREALTRISKSREADELGVMKVGLDVETDELERLIALVRVIKGHDDYRPHDATNQDASGESGREG
jgi:hypothetical protein